MRELSPGRPPLLFENQIQIYLDGADEASILEFVPNPLVRGFTTNPSLMRKAGVKDYASYCQALLPKLQGKPISFEVFADDPAEMERQALLIASWEKPGHPLYVKIPIVNSRGETCLPLVRRLSEKGVKINITALYKVTDVAATCEAVRRGAPALVSVFAGRIADVGFDPSPLISASAELCRAAGAQVELLWASTREAFNVIQAEKLGCRVITAPADVIRKVAGFGSKSLDDLTVETVQTFKKDSDAAGFRL